MRRRRVDDEDDDHPVTSAFETAPHDVTYEILDRTSCGDVLRTARTASAMRRAATTYVEPCRSLATMRDDVRCYAILLLLSLLRDRWGEVSVQTTRDARPLRTLSVDWRIRTRMSIVTTAEQRHRVDALSVDELAADPTAAVIQWDDSRLQSATKAIAMIDDLFAYAAVNRARVYFTSLPVDRWSSVVMKWGGAPNDGPHDVLTIVGGAFARAARLNAGDADARRDLVAQSHAYGDGGYRGVAQFRTTGYGGFGTGEATIDGATLLKAALLNQTLSSLDARDWWDRVDTMSRYGDDDDAVWSAMWRDAVADLGSRFGYGDLRWIDATVARFAAMAPANADNATAGDARRADAALRAVDTAYVGAASPCRAAAAKR